MLRYYYAAKLSGGIDDLDLNLEEFAAKANADIVGKVANLASRTARWLEATGLSATYPDDGGLFAQAAADGEAIAAAYEAGDFARAMRHVMQAADRANAYIDAEQPWKLAKAGPEAAGRLQDVASVAVNLFRQASWPSIWRPCCPGWPSRQATSWADRSAPGTRRPGRWPASRWPPSCRSPSGSSRPRWRRFWPPREPNPNHQRHLLQEHRR